MLYIIKIAQYYIFVICYKYKKGNNNMVETLVHNPEFDQNSTREIEQKFLPLFPERLADLREQAEPAWRAQSV